MRRVFTVWMKAWTFFGSDRFVGAATLLVAAFLSSEADAFLLEQVTTGPGTYTSANAVAPRPGLNSLHWDICRIRWSMNVKGAGDDLSTTVVREALDGALRAWKEVYPAALDLLLAEEPTDSMMNATDNVNTVYWAESLNDPVYMLLMDNSAAAVTILTVGNNQIIQDVDIVFNGRDFIWSTQGETSDDIQAIATHEVGHGIGIHHSDASPATMQQFYDGGTDWRTLEDDDRAAVNFLYPPPQLWISNFGYNAGGWRIDQHLRFLSDLNSDGKSDVIGFGNAGVSVALSTGSSFRTPQLWLGEFGYDAGGWRVDRHPRFVANVLGDAGPDVIGFGDAGMFVAINNGSGFDQPQLSIVRLFGYDDGWRVDRHPRFLANVGRFRADLFDEPVSDLVGFSDDGFIVAPNNRIGFGSPRLWLENFGYDAGGWRVDRHPRLIGDVNGDGLGDLVAFGNAGVSVALNIGNGFAQPRLFIADFGYNAGDWRVERHPRFVIDVTDDDKADIVGFADSGVLVARSTGNGFLPPELWIGNFGYDSGWRVERHPRFVVDVNRDEWPDVVGFGDNGVSVSLNTRGGSFERPRLGVCEFGYNAGGWRVDRHPRFIADVDGNGVPDFVGFGDDGVSVALRY